MSDHANTHVLTWESRERPGIVHAVTGVLLECLGDIIELKQFDDAHTQRVFLRIEFRDPTDASTSIDAIRIALAELAASHDARWSLRPRGERVRTIVMVSRLEHCLNDLLFRARIGDLPIEIVAVVSNHPDARSVVEWHNIPYVHIPISADTKPVAERQLLETIKEHSADLIVLARYMQVLSDELARELTGRAINIHHSFLPSFKGARPYHQAFERGVKTVGATAHYVNSELDEGPIIAQQVVEVDHSFGPTELANAGRDAECKALSNAVRWHSEQRVFLNGNRTVVLR